MRLFQCLFVLFCTRSRVHAHTDAHIHTHSLNRIHTHARTHAHARTHTHTRTHARTHACTHARTHVRTHTHTHIHFMYISLPAYIYKTCTCYCFDRVDSIVSVPKPCRRLRIHSAEQTRHAEFTGRKFIAFGRLAAKFRSLCASVPSLSDPCVPKYQIYCSSELCALFKGLSSADSA